METMIIALAVAIVGVSLGAAIGYEVGKADGEDATIRYYESKLRFGGAK